MSKATPDATLAERIFPDWLLPHVHYHRTADGEEWCHLRIYFPPFWPLEYIGPFQTKAEVDAWLNESLSDIGHTMADLSNNLSHAAHNTGKDEMNTTEKPALSLVKDATAKATKKGR